MPRSKKTLTENIRAPYAKGAGLLKDVSDAGIWDKGYRLRAYLDDTFDTYADVLGLDNDGQVSFGGAYALQGARQPCFFRAVLNAAVATTTFHIFNYSGRIVAIQERHTTAGDHASAVTAVITKDADGVAAGGGTALMSNSINLKGTADTDQNGTMSTATDRNGKSVLEFQAGDSLAFKLTGNAQNCAGVFVTVWVQPYVRATDFSWYSAAGTSQDQCFAVFNRPYAVRAVRYRHNVKEATAGSSAIQVTVDTSTNAPGAGTDLLTNNTNTGFNGKSANYVVQTGTFTAGTTPATGDRLAVDFSASNTELAGVCVTVTVFGQANRLEVPYWLYDGNNVDAYIFWADRDYEFWDARMVQAVAAGGTSTANIEKTLAGVVAAGAGTALLGTAWDLNATANTVVVGLPLLPAGVAAARSLLLIAQNEKLSIDYANAEQNTAGVCLTISLMTR